MGCPQNSATSVIWALGQNFTTGESPEVAGNFSKNCNKIIKIKILLRKWEKNSKYSGKFNF